MFSEQADESTGRLQYKAICAKLLKCTIKYVTPGIKIWNFRAGMDFTEHRLLPYFKQQETDIRKLICMPKTAQVMDARVVSILLTHHMLSYNQVSIF